MDCKDEIEENLKFGVIDIIILELLSNQDMYDIKLNK